MNSRESATRRALIGLAALGVFTYAQVTSFARADSSTPALQYSSCGHHL
jgi:hypothetical protein